MALVGEITVQGRILTLYNAHLESRGDDGLRYDQLREMLSEIVHGSEARVVVAGDFNFDVSRGPAAELVRATQLDNPFMSLGGRPTALRGRNSDHARIDWILSGKCVSARNPEIRDSIAASDHFPLSLQIRLL